MAHTALSAHSTRWEVFPMGNMKIREIWDSSYQDYCSSGHFQSDAQLKASRAILNCKSGKCWEEITPSEGLSSGKGEMS